MSYDIHMKQPLYMNLLHKKRKSCIPDYNEEDIGERKIKRRKFPSKIQWSNCLLHFKNSPNSYFITFITIRKHHENMPNNTQQSFTPKFQRNKIFSVLTISDSKGTHTEIEEILNTKTTKNNY
jgi:hypothetical protein